MAQTEADPPPIRKIEAWREGDWILLALDGEIVWRRLTRDRAFTHVLPGFWWSECTPRPPSRCDFQAHLTVLFGSGWRPPYRQSSKGSKIPILPSRGYVEPPLASTTSPVFAAEPFDGIDFDWDD